MDDTVSAARVAHSVTSGGGGQHLQVPSIQLPPDDTTIVSFVIKKDDPEQDPNGGDNHKRRKGNLCVFFC